MIGPFFNSTVLKIKNSLNLRDMLKPIKTAGIIFILFTGLQACTHINQKIHNLPIRASKSKILKTLGYPYKINRKHGKDYWTYKFVIDGRHYTRDIIIKDSLLYRKSKLQPFSLKNF